MKTKLKIWIILLFATAYANAQGWTETEIGLPTPYANTTLYKFGQTVSIDGNVAVVGAPDADNGKGRAYIFERIAGTWQPVAELRASDADIYDYFGTSVSISGDVAVVGAKFNDNGALVSGAVYVFEKAPGGWVDMTQTAKLSASDANVDDKLGISVAISGNTIVAGAYHDDDNGSNSGSVYVFEKPGTHWVSMTQTAKLKASDGASNDIFGYSVAISNDVIVAGAYQDDDLGSNSGSAYVFEKPVTGWANGNENAKITASDGAGNDNFGNSVAVSGNTIVIGAYRKDQSVSDAGTAYVFEKPVSGWVTATQTAKLDASDVTSFKQFGSSVAISGNQIIVGAFNDVVSGMCGSAYIFEKPVSGWVNTTQTCKIIGSDIADGDKFGVSVGFSGDYAMVGSYYNDSLGSNAGSAYIFEKPISGWTDTTENIEIFANTEISNIYDEFGNAIDISGDYAVVGSHLYQGNKGRADVYHFNGTAWDKIAVLSPSDGAINDEFGISVSIDNDVIVIGSKNADGIDVNTGAAYLFEKPATGWVSMTETAKLTSSEGIINDAFGTAVDVDGDVVVVTSPQDAESGIASGTAFIFIKPSTGWVHMTQIAKLKPNDGAAYDNFGNAVALNDSILVVGAMGNDETFSDQGSAYIFIRPTTGWTNMYQTAKIVASDGAASDNFCTSISINGDMIAIGAPYSDIPTINCGSVYLYQRPVGGWVNMTENAKLTASDAMSNDNFGASVSLSDSILIAGAKQPNVAGKVYVFNKAASGWVSANQDTILLASDAAYYDGFGTAVAMSRENAIIGAPQNDDHGMNSGSIYFFRNIAEAATITLEPADNENVCANSTAVFQINASYATSIQWQHSFNYGVSFSNIVDDGLMYFGSQTTTLSIATELWLNGCQYRCIVSNTLGADTSNAALLTTDAISPVVTSTHSDQIISAGSNCEALLPDYTSTIVATDNCTSTLNIGQTPSAGSTISGNTNIVTITVSDDYTNFSEITFNVAVVDDADPTITCIGNQTVELTQGQSYYTVAGNEFDPISVDDNCGVDLVTNDFNSASTLASAQLPIGTSTIEWTVTDNEGNVATCSFDVTVNAFVGIGEPSNTSFSVVPNPASDFIVIQAGDENLDAVNICDVTGKIVLAYSHIAAGQIISISELNSGVYFVNIQTQKGVETHRIVKE